ncbi:MAG: translational GTPase TypA [Rickettsiales bacterium]
MTKIKNIAIIAHVDHGKTTIIDEMLKQSGTFRDNQSVDERVMDSNDLEKERGITILAKCTSIRLDDLKLNIIDTPGHADFGGEVERVLSMVDSCLLLVDSAEGPMPQTKFVLSKALKLGLKPIVIINKIDRGDARPDEVIDEVFDLFVSLDANEDQLDFTILYAAGRDGWCTKELEDERVDFKPLFDTIVAEVPAPNVDATKPFSMLATLLQSDPYLGRILTGKVYSGIGKINSSIKAMNLDGKTIESGRLTKLFGFEGIEKVPSETVQAGDIVAIAGLEKASVSDTICSTEFSEPIKSTPIDPPTMSIMIGANNSPLAGTEGDKVTSRMILDRLNKEAETNVAISIRESDEKDFFTVSGRGELQLGVLIENMRREGFELSVSKPMVLYKQDKSGQKLEPIEEAVIDVDEEYSGVIVEKLSQRKGDMIEMRPSMGGKTRIIFHIPTRGLIGYQREFMTDTKGTGVLNRLFHAYEPFKGEIGGRINGSLISMASGEAVAYALWNIEERGILFVTPQAKVYDGMIIGINSRPGDLEVNPIKGKQLSNVRSVLKDESIKLSPPKQMTIEDAIAYLESDELLEVTPKSIRLRKKHLDANARKRASRDKNK